LLTETYEGSEGIVISTFHASSGTETPAASTLALVLYGGGGAFSYPVYGFCGFGGEIFYISLALGGHWAKIGLLEFLMSEIGEMVNSHSVGMSSGVMSVDLGDILMVDGHAGIVLLKSVIRLSKGVHVVLELKLIQVEGLDSGGSTVDNGNSGYYSYDSKGSKYPDEDLFVASA
jgi:ABC-type transporter Mla MlaB component